jgi:hypothetical protein
MAVTKISLQQIAGINDFPTLQEVLKNLLSEIEELKEKVANLESEKE